MIWARRAAGPDDDSIGQRYTTPTLGLAVTREGVPLVDTAAPLRQDAAVFAITAEQVGDRHRQSRNQRCRQDITGLEGQIRFERLVAGHPASVNYDPSNPSDSILVADDWSGLR